jgi:cell division septation protein DedD
MTHARRMLLALAAGAALLAGCASGPRPAPPSLPTAMPSEEESRRVAPGAGEAIARRPEASGFRVQLLATADRALAERRAQEARTAFPEPVRIDEEGTLFKVRVGAGAPREEAEALRSRAVALGYEGAFVVSIDEPAR